MKKNLRPSSSSKELSTNKSFPVDLKPVTNYTGNIYKIRTQPNLPESRYLSKVCPNKIATDKEKLYEENINLKQMYNFINDENLRLRTKIIQLEKNSEKKSNNLGSPNTKSSHLLDSLNAKIKDQKIEIQAKDKEIEDMKKYVRYTKMQELEGEVRQFSNECMRLKRIINDLLVEKNFVPQGIGIYEKIKRDNEEMSKLLNYYKENEKIKNEKVEELLNTIKESEENHKKQQKNALKISPKIENNEFELENQRLSQKIESQDVIINELQEKLQSLNEELLRNNLNSNTENKSSEINDIEEDADEIKAEINQSINQHAQQFCGKIKLFLSNLKISSDDWVNSISKSGIISKSDLKLALLQDDVNINDEELECFMQEHGENDEQVLSSVLIELFKGSEQEILTIDEAFDEIKAKATYCGIKNIQKYLETSIEENEVTESDIMQLLYQGVFNVQNPLTLNLFIKHIMENRISISKCSLITKFVEGFQYWVNLTVSEIEGILRRFQALMFDNYEELISRLQEKTRFQAFTTMDDLIQELKIYEIISTISEECCAKAVIYYYSKSIKKVPYLDVLYILYENNVDKEFTKFIPKEINEDDEYNSGNPLITETYESEEIIDNKKEVFNIDTNIENE